MDDLIDGKDFISTKSKNPSTTSPLIIVRFIGIDKDEDAFFKKIDDSFVSAKQDKVGDTTAAFSKVPKLLLKMKSNVIPIDKESCIVWNWTHKFNCKKCSAPGHSQRMCPFSNEEIKSYKNGVADGCFKHETYRPKKQGRSDRKKQPPTKPSNHSMKHGTSAENMADENPTSSEMDEENNTHTPLTQKIHPPNNPSNTSSKTNNPTTNNPQTNNHKHKYSQQLNGSPANTSKKRQPDQSPGSLQKEVTLESNKMSGNATNNNKHQKPNKGN
jgi:hypothetical protein